MSFRKILMTNGYDPYGVLGIPTDGTEEEIRQAYHDLVRVWHPNRFQSDRRLQEIAQERLRKINEAYETLQWSEGNQRTLNLEVGTP